jgi:hypothetical protein
MSLIREGWDRARPDVPERADRALEQFWVSTAWLRSRPRGRRLVAATWRAASADLSPSFKPVPPARHTVGGTMSHLDNLLAGIDVTLSDDILDRIDEVVPPGTDIGTLDQAYVPPAIQLPSLRRRHADHRAAA